MTAMIDISSRGQYRFRKYEKLRDSKEFQLVKTGGRRVRAAHFGFNYRTNGLPYHRLGLVVQKKYWNAVQRNRIKRCLRECFRLHKDRIPVPGKDIVVIARPGAEKLTFQEVEAEFVGAWSMKDGRSA